MTGNVWEWLEDDYHDYYDSAQSTAVPWVDSPRGQFRVIRGSSWRVAPPNFRVANRGRRDPAVRFDFIGFRVARSTP